MLIWPSLDRLKQNDVHPSQVRRIFVFYLGHEYAIVKEAPHDAEFGLKT